MQPDSLTSFCSPQIFLLLIIVFILAYDYFAKNPWKRLPPGPPALPIVGSLPFLGWDVREPLRKLSAKYGDVFTIYLGTRCCVVLNSYDAIKEAFVKHTYTFAGRPPVYFITGITEGHGIVSSQGPLWQEQRRYSLHILRNFGFGRKILQDRILEEIDFFNKELKRKLGVPFDPHLVIQKAVANVIALVTFGARMEYDDSVFLHYMDIMNRTFDILGNSGILNVFPFVRFFPGDFFRAKQLQRDVDFMMSEYKRIIEQHKAAADKGEKPSDFISAYLEKMNQEKDKKESTFTERQLLAVIGDLFGAGTETTTTTLVWAVLYMTLNEDIQDRVHKEIHDLIGSEGVPQMEHRTMLPFTEACLLEIQRLGDIVPLGVPHCATEDTQFKGYFIPEGTTIITNLYSVHRDPELWPDPEAFKPERFLDEEGKVIRKEQLIPFSLGKRQCLGESLAKMELFLLFTSMMLHFRFRPAPGYPLPDSQGLLGITNMPKRFHVLIEARNSK